MSQSAAGVLPDNIDSLVADIIREVGVPVVTRKIVRERLEQKLHTSLEQNKNDISSSITRVLDTPEFAQLMKEHQRQERSPRASGDRARANASSSNRKRSRSNNDDHSGSGSNAPARRGGRERKPDDYPKAALSAYILFSNDLREKIQSKNPTAKITEVSKMIATEWSNASDSTKERYRKLADAEKQRFERDMAAYKAKGGEVIKRGRKKGERRAAKDPNAPKRALSAYMYFAQDFRKRNSQLDIKEQMRQAGAAWNSMSPAAKKPFEDKAAKDKERYAREVGRRSK